MKVYQSPRLVETRVAEFFGYNSAVIFGRARSAITALLETLGGENEVAFIVPSNVCPSIVAAGATAKANIITVDVEKETGLPSDEAFSAAIRKEERPGVVMPTYLYGFHRDYNNTLAVSRDRGWFVLENDTSATRALTNDSLPKNSAGDALLVSFGSGKVIDGGSGGALLSDDIGIVNEMRKRVAKYPPLDEKAHIIERQLVHLRRLLQNREVNYPTMCCLYEKFLPYEVSTARLALPEVFDESIITALETFPDKRLARIKQVGEWEKLLSDISDDIAFVPLEQHSPWRFIARILRRRDLVIRNLRSKGYDVGTNYPPLHYFFPNRIDVDSSIGGDGWGNEVINLWLTPEYNEQRMITVAELIRQTLSNHG